MAPSLFYVWSSFLFSSWPFRLSQVMDGCLAAFGRVNWAVIVMSCHVPAPPSTVSACLSCHCIVLLRLSPSFHHLAYHCKRRGGHRILLCRRPVAIRCFPHKSTNFFC